MNHCIKKLALGLCPASSGKRYIPNS